MPTRIIVGAVAALFGSMLVAQPETDEPEPQPESCPKACCFDAGAGGREQCDVFDFLAFQTAWVVGDPCAIDMDTSTGVGVGDIFDFLAFQYEFLQGPRFGFPC